MSDHSKPAHRFPLQLHAIHYNFNVSRMNLQHPCLGSYEPDRTMNYVQAWCHCVHIKSSCAFMSTTLLKFGLVFSQFSQPIIPIIG